MPGSDHALNLVGSCNGPDRVGQPRVGFIPHLPAPQSLNPLDPHPNGEKVFQGNSQSTSQMALHQDDKPIFTPESPDEKNVERFRTAINQKRGLNLTDYRQLQEYSVHPETFQQFWQDVWDFVGIKASRLSKDVIARFSLGLY